MSFEQMSQNISHSENKPFTEYNDKSNLRNVFFNYPHDEITETITNDLNLQGIFNKKIKIPKFKGNKVNTSRYNYFNFIPKSILIQFMRIYNFYFLATVILQAIPQISTSPIYLAVLPFAFVIGVSVIRELIEEIKRRRNDQKINSSNAMVLKDSKFNETSWANLKVGDIVLVQEDETIPADLLLLQCSNPYGNSYIQTMTLDGERALKPKQAFTEIIESMRTQKVGLSKMKMHLMCEIPNNNIYQFEGKLKVDSPQIGDFKATYSQFLLRGAVLTNTDWVIGMVVYAGHDTKLMKNMGKVKYKQTHIERTLNKIVIFLILFQFILCITVAIQATYFNQHNQLKASNGKYVEGVVYLYKDVSDSESSAFTDFITSLCKFFLLLSSIIPISLLVSLEIVKVIQSFTFFFDANMFSIAADQGCKVMSVSLNEELGLITDIFTDKTGTLTSNEMVFKACAVGLVCYNVKSVEKFEQKIDTNSDIENQDGFESYINPLNDSDTGEKVLNYQKYVITNHINDWDFYNEYKFGFITISSQIDFINYFWLGISLCHEVISISKIKQKIVKQHYDHLLIDHIQPSGTQQLDLSQNDANKLNSKNEDEEQRESLENDSFEVSEENIDENDELVYHGMSPDEITLVNSAKKAGFEFRYRSNKQIEIKILNERKVYNLLKIFPFTSDRKRMTIVVQDPENPDYAISFTKGADNVMKSLCLPDYTNHFNFEYINKFAKKGYRTLIVGMKVFQYNEFIIWQNAYDVLVNEVGATNNTEEINNLVFAVEKDLFLLGTTALEDKLQENVHQCIEEFRRANIKVWMITGDKLETAENIGISCRLLHEDSDRFYLTSKENSTLQCAKSIYKQMKRIEQLNNNYASNCTKNANLQDLNEENQRNINDDNQNKTNCCVKDKIKESQSKEIEDNYSNLSPIKTMSKSSPRSKKIKIGEKKMYVNQMIFESSINTSLNFLIPHKMQKVDLNFELVIEGDCLATMLQIENRVIFGKILNKTHAVLLCRSSPKQKSEIIEFAKSINPKMVSLAIGDGGNDVSMIKTADVGIGIFGKEGYQAVNASDYAIAEFQYLRRLMFIHGRYCVRRMTIFITQFLVRNILLSMCQYAFAYYSAYSGQTFFEPGYVMVFNLISTQITLSYLAVYDQDISPSSNNNQKQLLMPYLYSEMRDKLCLSYRDFFIWYFYAIYSAIAIFYINYYSYYKSISEDGYTFGFWQVSFTCYFAICAVNYLIVLVKIQAWNYVTLIFFAIHLLLFYPGWVFLYNEWPLSNIYKNELEFYNYGLFWLTDLLIIWAIIMPIVFFKRFKSLFFPSLTDLVISNRLSENQEIEEMLKIDQINIENEDSDGEQELLKKFNDLKLEIENRETSNYDNDKSIKISEQFSINQMKESQEESNNSEDLRGNSSGSKEHSSSEEDKSDMEIDVGHKHAESSSFIMFTCNVKKYETNKRLHSTFNNVKKKTFKYFNSVKKMKITENTETHQPLNFIDQSPEISKIIGEENSEINKSKFVDSMNLHYSSHNDSLQ